MSENTIEKNYKTYKTGLIKILGEDIANAIIEVLGGEEKVADATYANLADTGAAFKGSFIRNIIRLTNYAYKINALLPEEYRANSDSINKVCLLSQIAKVLIYSENPNNWEVVNRGMIYKFNELDGALRIGERSTLIAMNAGVKFNEIEFEAMRILDKASDDDNYTKYYASSLSTVVRQANELVTMVNRKEAKNG